MPYAAGSNWERSTRAHLERLRARRLKVKADAEDLVAESQKKLDALKTEYRHMGTQVRAVEAALAAHTGEVAPSSSQDDMALSLPAPASQERAEPQAYVAGTDQPATSVLELLKEWVRAPHREGQFVTGDFAQHLVETGRLGSLDSARSSIAAALGKIGKGFTRTGHGTYKFYALDGEPLFPDRPPDYPMQVDMERSPGVPINA